MRPRNFRRRRQGEVVIFIAIMVAAAVAILGAIAVMQGVGLAAFLSGQNGGAGSPTAMFSDAEDSLADSLDTVQEKLEDAENAYSALVAAKQPLVDAGAERRGGQEERAALEAELADADRETRARREQELASLLEAEEGLQETEGERLADYAIARERFQQALIALDGALDVAEPLLTAYEQAALEAQQEAARSLRESAGASESTSAPAGDPIDRSYAAVLDAARARHGELSDALDGEFPPGPELVPDELDGAPEEEAGEGEAKRSFVVAAVVEKPDEGEFAGQWVVVEDGYVVLEWDREASDSAGSAEELAAGDIVDLQDRFPGQRIVLVQLDGFAEAPQVEVGAPLSRLDGRIEVAEPGGE